MGANDELTLSLSGLNELTNTAVLSREGNYELPHAGFVNLNGLTIDQATQQIKNRLRVPYPGLASGRTRFLERQNQLAACMACSFVMPWIER